jgi:uncharacterized protein YyaL (SSP411 family)
VRLALLTLLAIAAASAQQHSLKFGAEALGAEQYSRALKRSLNAAWNDRASDYIPRTRHLNDDGSPKYTNRLFVESSPYLLQHSHNPVDWHPWGDEAFDKARDLGRPVLLSVGYSTCHWCHVMEEESFEDEEIARFINEHYIAIKVDREQRPDIDGVYLAAVQAMTGRGGWPMTVWLNPKREPFYAGTYFPPHDGDRGVQAGFLTLLTRMNEIYSQQPATIANNSSLIAERVAVLLSSRSSGNSPSEAVLTTAVAGYKQRFDAVNGGVQGAPKFPSGLPVRLLLDEYRATKEEALLTMASTTLTAMANGGIRDHVNGGFHRYTTDAQWRTPHFEKMLYDNALLASTFIEGWRASGDASYQQATRDILRFISAEMTAPSGGFYSATDADSLNPRTRQREEGYYFTWTPEELVQTLGATNSAVASALWSVSVDGDVDGRNVLRHDRSLAEIAAQFQTTETSLLGQLTDFGKRMRASRTRRPKPLRDDKILTDWNGLMISAFAEAAFAFNEPAYAEIARRAAQFILDEMRVDGRLQRSSLNGTHSGEGYLDDYASLIAGLISLYEATGEIEWLREAITLDQVLAAHFAHPAGGYYLTADDHEELIVRQQPAYDGSEPSGNSVQAMNLLRLHEFTTDDDYRVRADKLLAQFSASLDRNPAELSELLRALRWRLSKPKQVLFVAKSVEGARELASEMRSIHLPHRIVSIAAESAIDEITATIPLFADKRAISGRPTAYVCEERVCKLPTSDPEKLRELLAE